MTNGAIDHVLEVEKTVAKIRQDAQEKIQQINIKKQDQMMKINENLEHELQAFKESKHQELQGKLTAKTEENKQSIHENASDYDQIYNQKKEKMTDYIVKEVLKRYGS